MYNIHNNIESQGSNSVFVDPLAREAGMWQYRKGQSLDSLWHNESSTDPPTPLTPHPHATLPQNTSSGPLCKLHAFPQVQCNLPPQAWKCIRSTWLERGACALHAHSLVALWTPCPWWKTTKGETKWSPRKGRASSNKWYKVCVLFNLFKVNARKCIQRWNNFPSLYHQQLGVYYFSLYYVISLHYLSGSFCVLIICPLVCANSCLIPDPEWTGNYRLHFHN